MLNFDGNGLANGDASAAFERFLILGEKESGQLRKLISIGGWGISEEFSDIAASRKSRRSFAKSVVSFVRKHGLDGVDLDWEYPVAGGAPNQVHRAEDRGNLVKLVEAIRDEWEEVTSSAGDPFLVTMAVPGTYAALSTRYDFPELSKFVDWFHVMAYDYAGTWSVETGYFSPLFADGFPLYRQFSAAGAVAAIENLGVDPEQIVLGVGLAGIRFEEVLPRGNQWVGVPFVSMNERRRADSWNDTRNLEPVVVYPLGSQHSWELRWDEAAVASYWISMDSRSLISFESARSVTEKAEYVKGKGLRGMMFWSLEKDSDDLGIIRAVSAVLKPPAKEVDAGDWESQKGSLQHRQNWRIR